MPVQSSFVSPANPFSVRDWFGLAGGICWGLVLSRFFSSDDMTGPWLVILFGPPVVLLISSARPLLSWQLPIVTAAIAAAFMNRTMDDSPSGALADAALWWFLCSLLSSPWALMFHHRSRRFRQLGKAPGIPIAYIGMVLLVFVCCGLTLLGFWTTAYSTDGGTHNRALPFYGLLAATAGIALSVMTECAARKLEVQKLVRGVFELLMIPGVILVIVDIVALFWRDSSSPHAVVPGVLSGMLAGLEALATMVWLTRLDRREPPGAVQAQ